MSGDGIFLIHDNGGMVEMQAEGFATEDELQELLATHPSVIPGGKIDPESPPRFLLVAREVGVPASEDGFDQFSLDHLFVDQYATPTLVEVKRSTDTRIRREVVGQMLDYAANGSRYWPIAELRRRFDHEAALRGADPDAVLAEFLREAPSDADSFWRQVETNLRAGRVRMLFVADVIPAALQRIVEFLNEQMKPAEVLAVELRHYRGEGVRTLVPRLLGATAAAKDNKGVRDQRGFEELLATADPEVRTLDDLVLSWAEQHGLAVTNSPRARKIRSADGDGIMQLYVPQGWLEFAFGPLREAGMDAEIDRLGRALDGFAGRRLTRKAPYFAGTPLLPRWQQFLDTVMTPYLQARTLAGKSDARNPQDDGVVHPPDQNR
jgi:hypothetical protein